MRLLCCLAVWVLVFCDLGHGKTLRVGTKVVPPFSFKPGPSDPAPPIRSKPWGGWSWDYFDTELFPRLQEALNYTEYEVLSFAGNTELLAAVESGEEVDLGLAATTITVAREEVVDFGVPFFQSSFRTLVRADVDNSEAFGLVLGTLLNLLLMFAVGVLALVVSNALLIYALEDYEPGALPTIRLGSVWTALYDALRLSGYLVLVGAGTRFPKGKYSQPMASVASGWSVLLPVILTAVATVSFSTLELPADISSFADLENRRVLVGVGSTAEAFLEEATFPITILRKDTITEALDAFFDGEGDAVFYDYAVLEYAAKKEMEQSDSKYAVVGDPLAPEVYGIPVPDKVEYEELREALDKAILDSWEKSAYRIISERWLAAPVVETSIISDNAQRGAALAVIGAALVGFALLVAGAVFLLKRNCPRAKPKRKRPSIHSATLEEIKKLDSLLHSSISAHDSDLIYTLLLLLGDMRREQLQDRVRSIHSQRMLAQQEHGGKGEGEDDSDDGQAGSGSGGGGGSGPASAFLHSSPTIPHSSTTNLHSSPHSRPASHISPLFIDRDEETVINPTMREFDSEHS